MRTIARLVCVGLLLVATILVSPVAAQRIVDEKGRREAAGFYRSGQEFMAAEKFDRAVEQFSKAAKRDPLFPLADYSLGRAYMYLRRYEDAITAYRACVEGYRNLHALQLANHMEAEQLRKEQIVELRHAIDWLQQQDQRRGGETSSLHALQLEQQLHYLQINTSPTIDGPFQPPAEVLLALGSAFFRHGDWEPAEDEWKAAVALNPKFGEAHNNLAVMYMETRRYAAAEQEIKAAERGGFRVNPQLKADLKRAEAEQEAGKSAAAPGPSR